MHSADAQLIVRTPGPAVLFLDIDGVLHPGFVETLEHLPLLERALRGYPHVDVVVSSNWRCNRTIAELQLLLGRLGARVIGCTPEFPGRAREEEIDWFCHYFAVGERLVLDDDESQFRPAAPGVFLINPETGLTGDDLCFVRRWASRSGCFDPLHALSFGRFALRRRA